MSERLEEIINDLPYSIRHEGSVEELVEYARGQSVQVDKLAGKMAELNVFLQRFADEKGWGKNVVDIAIKIMEEQSEQKELSDHKRKIVYTKAENLMKQNKRYREWLEIAFKADDLEDIWNIEDEYRVLESESE